MRTIRTEDDRLDDEDEKVSLHSLNTGQYAILDAGQHTILDAEQNTAQTTTDFRTDFRTDRGKREEHIMTITFAEQAAQQTKAYAQESADISVATYVNGSTTTIFVGNMTVSEGNIYLKNTGASQGTIFELPHHLYSIEKVGVAGDAIDMWSTDERLWTGVQNAEVLGSGDYARVVTRYGDIIKITSGIVEYADESIIRFRGNSYDQTLAVYLNTENTQIFRQKDELSAL